MLGHMSIIVLSLFILMCLSIENPNRQRIIVLFMNEVTFAMYVTIEIFIFGK